MASANFSPRERVAAGALIGGIAASLASGLVLPPFTPRFAIVLAIGAALGAWLVGRRRALLWTFLVLALAAWGTVAFTDVARWATRGLVRRDPVPRSASAVVVLSASVSDDGLLGQEAIDRLLAGMQLIRTGVAPTLVVTVWHAADHPDVTSSADQRRITALLPAGMRLVQVTRIGTTRTEALRTSETLPPRTTPAIVVVTSPLHSRRACATFEHVGYRVTCAPSESRDVALGALRSARDRIYAFRMAVYEHAALWWYHWKGWL